MAGSFAPNVITTKPAVYTKGGVVAAQNTKAATIGAEILAAGGNAMDAAIATSFALAACEPWMSGLGGGGALLHFDRAAAQCSAIEFNMIAPRQLDPAAYPLADGVAGDLFGWPAVVEDRNIKGALAMAVPGQLAGIDLAHRRFGSMPLAELIGPAIALAEEGLQIDWFASLIIGTAGRDLARDPACAATYIADGFAPVPDWTGAVSSLPLGGLPETLRQVAAEGPESFYRGDLAQRVQRDLAAVGSIITKADLEAYDARMAEPLTFAYRQARVTVLDGLFAGRSLKMALERLAALPLAGDWPDDNAFCAYVEALREAYAHRFATMGDVTAAPTESCTSHLAAVDASGNMVSLTQTLLSLFGSRVLLPETGILMNNGIMWFDPRPGRPNSMAPGKRPLANMCPVIAENDAIRFALGASGGRRIMPAVMQILCFLLDHGMSLEEAFAQPRIDMSGADVAMSQRLSGTIREALSERYSARTLGDAPYPLAFACPSAVLHDLVDDYRYGTAEVSQPWADAVATPTTPD